MSTKATSPVSKVYNLIILDESGSMERIRTATVNGFNELLQTIRSSRKEHPDMEQWVSFYSFNSGGIKEHLPLVSADYLQTLSPELYNPDGGTPLYDAIGYAVNRLRSQLAGEERYQVVATVFTDGEENMSREYSHEAVAALIAKCRKDGWLFAYVGANHDVERAAASMNINNHMRFDATEDGAAEMFKTSAMASRNYMHKLKTGASRTDDYFSKKPSTKK